MPLSLLLALTLQSISPPAEGKAVLLPDDIYEKLAAKPPYLSKARLPKGYKIGRCLLEVNGQQRISGPCTYHIERGGAFHIDGPRQVFSGIDFPKAEVPSEEISTDYWANVFKDLDGNWTGHGNENIRYTRGDGSAWGKLTRRGACFSNETNPPKADEYQQSVKLCLWKK